MHRTHLAGGVGVPEAVLLTGDGDFNAEQCEEDGAAGGGGGAGRTCTGVATALRMSNQN